MKSLLLLPFFFIHVQSQIAGQFGLGLPQYGQQGLFGQQQLGFGIGGTQCLFGPLTPLNGQLRYSTGSLLGPYPAGTIVSNQCNVGYMPSGISQASCLNGQWNPPTLGECILTQNLGLGFNNQFGKK